MQLNITTDYATRIMGYLGRATVRCNVNEISDAMDIPLNNARRIMQLLKKSGLVKPVSGKGGGYTLGKSVENITLLDIMTAIDDTLMFGGNVENYYDPAYTESHIIGTVFGRIRSFLETELSLTLAQLIEGYSL